MADEDRYHQDGDGVAGNAALVVGGDNSVIITNSTVTIIGGDYYERDQPSPSPEEKEKQICPKQQPELEFLAKVKRHLTKAMDEVQNLKSRPTAMVVETDSGIRNATEKFPVDVKNHLGRDLKEIDLAQVHDPMDNISPKHVMVLGEAGAGKSIFSKMYSLAVSKRNVTALHDIKLVHFVNAAKFQCQTTSSAFHLFFIDRLAQYPDTKLTSDEAKSGREWLEKNSDKVLIAIDGLDQCLEDFSKRKDSAISEMTPANANDLIANIIAGKIWHHARILTSSRWNLYWELNIDQKPDKVIALRGFDDENLETAASYLSTDGGTMLDQLRRNSPTFLSVCRNPMFLKYMTTMYQSDRGSLPNSISGLLSAVFRNFLRSYKIKDFKSITKLAYNGMLDNLFVIPYTYVQKLEINPEDLKNFCSPGAILEKGCENVSPYDTFYVFSHQTMQEYCCALHVLNLKKYEIEEFAANSLNKSRMTLTRQLLYGLIMNDTVTKPMRNYLNFGATSIDDCRNILFSQLRCMIGDGTLCDMKTIHMLSECGDDIVRQIKSDVHRILIHADGLLHNDQIVLATMTKKLSPIREVWVLGFVLEPSVIQCVKDCLGSADSFKIQKLVIVDKSMTEDGYEELANLLSVTKCNGLCFKNYDLNNNKMTGLLKKCETGNMEIENLDITVNSKTGDGYGELARLLNVGKCNVLRLVDCDLNKKKLHGLLKEFLKGNVKIQTLFISDKSMTEDGYGELANLLHVMKCDLDLTNCDLNRNKLAVLSEECQKGNVKITQLCIIDKLMRADGYKELSKVINVTKCNILHLIDCDLNKNKLAEIFKECEYGNIKKMYFLNIYENRSTASDEEVSSLCELMTNSLSGLVLRNWEIDARGIQRLKETFRQETSQMLYMLLPSGEYVCKYQWAEQYFNTSRQISKKYLLKNFDVCFG